MYGYLFIIYIVVYYIYTHFGVSCIYYIYIYIYIFTLTPHLFNLTSIPKLYPSVPAFSKRVICCILRPSIHATHKRKILSGTRKYTPSPLDSLGQEVQLSQDTTSGVKDPQWFYFTQMDMCMLSFCVLKISLTKKRLVTNHIQTLGHRKSSG